MTADAAAQRLVAWMDDPAVPYGVRVKVAQDLMDRAGLGAKQVIEVGPKEADPVETLFKELLADPANLQGPVSEVVRGELVESSPDLAQEALDRLNESWQPDAEVTAIRPGPADYGPVGPHNVSPASSTKVPRHIVDGLDLKPRRR